MDDDSTRRIFPDSTAAQAYSQMPPTRVDPISYVEQTAAAPLSPPPAPLFKQWDTDRGGRHVETDYWWLAGGTITTAIAAALTAYLASAIVLGRWLYPAVPQSFWSKHQLIGPPDPHTGASVLLAVLGAVGGGLLLWLLAQFTPAPGVLFRWLGLMGVLAVAVVSISVTGPAWVSTLGPAIVRTGTLLLTVSVLGRIAPAIFAVRRAGVRHG